MSNFTKTFFTLLLTVSAFALQAQNANVLWSEDFSDGLPTDWTNIDASGQGAVFTWCGDPATGSSDGCPSIFDDNNNLQSPFDSETALNGFITMDSDALTQLPADHVSELTTTTIDLTAETEVWFSAQMHIGVFAVSAVENAILRVSTDNENWTNYTIFPNTTTGARWSENPEVPVINISDAAAGNVVYLQFQWTGNWEYIWNIDDIVMYDGDPRFENDLQVNDFYAASPNYSYPEGQLEAFGFLADISNTGALDQTGIELTLNIDENGTEVFETVLAYEPIPIDSTVENIPFAEQFTPTGGAGTLYTGTYSISADVADDNTVNDTQTFEFQVSDTLFSKAPGIDGVISPGFAGATNYQWAYGCHYHVVNGAGKFARTMSFALIGTEENTGIDVFVSLYKVNGDGSDEPADLRAVTPEERELLGVTIYTIDGTEAFTDIITVPITQLGGDPISLEDNTDYLAVIEFKVTGPIRVTLGANRTLDNSAQDLLMENAGLFRFTQVLSVAEDIDLDDYGTDGFSGATPYVTLSIGDTPVMTSAISNQLSEDNFVQLSPNPASNQAFLGLDLVTLSENVEVTIFDAKGSTHRIQSFENIKTANLSLNIRDLAEGMYFVRVRTDMGVAVRSLVVSK